MRQTPAGVFNARLSLGRRVVSIDGPISFTPRSERLRKWCNVAAAVFVAMLTASAARADGPDISAQRLLASWKDEDPSMRMVAEVIASAFASGFSWAAEAKGRKVYCAPADLRGGQIMSAFEEFLRDNPKMAPQPYGVAMAATLSQAFPCGAQ
jgi:Ssp1 endopeptidase immunity protein Rap1a